VGYRTRSRPIHIAANYLTIVLLMPIATILLSYITAAWALPWADDLILTGDHWLHFKWPEYFYFFKNRPVLYNVMEIIYQSWFFEVLVILALLAVTDNDKAKKFVVTLTISAIMTAILFGLFPVHDAATLYHVPNTAGDGWSSLLDVIRARQPIPADKRMVGLVSFPSFHTSVVALLIWILLPFGRICYPLHVYNCILAMAIPVIGLHHLCDMIGGVAVALASIAFANALERWLPDVSFLAIFRLISSVRR